MPKRNNNNRPSRPPEQQGPSLHGGANETTQLQWVLQEQHYISEQIGSLGTGVENINSTLKDIKDEIKELRKDTTNLDKSFNKVKFSVIGGISAFSLVIAIAGFVLSDKFSKVINLLQELSKTQGG